MWLFIVLSIVSVIVCLDIIFSKGTKGKKQNQKKKADK